MLQKEKLHPPLAAANILERERRLEAYYREIDCASRLGDRDQGVRLDAQSALQRIIDLFEPTANYNRAGLLLEGREKIERWLKTPYPEGRLGFIGNHAEVKVYRLNDQSYFSTGVFTRTDGWNVEFADRWDFAPNGSHRIVLRTTYLSEDKIPPVTPANRFAREGECAILNSIPTDRFQMSDGMEITFKVERRENRDTTFVDCGHWANNVKKRYYCDGYGILRPPEK